MSAIAEVLETTAGQSTGQPDWLVAARTAQREHFRRHGLPNPRLENWKYTALRGLEAGRFEPAGTPATLVPEDLPDLAVPGARWRMVFVDGHYMPTLSMLDELPEGVILHALAELPPEEWDRWRDLLEADFGAPDEALAALCAGSAADGAALRIADGVELPEAIQLVHLSLAREQPVVANHRTLIMLGSGAAATIHERFLALGPAANFTNTLAQVRLASGARLEQLRLQQAGDASVLVTRQDCRLERDARARYHGYDVGGKLVRHDLNFELAEPGADVSLNGVYALDGKRHVDNHVRIDHAAPHTRSDEFFKGVLDGRARAVFNGKVVVHPGADKTDAVQTNKNLVLSRHAEVDTKPELEIYADDVKCAHGATVGQLDERQLFYLRSRGLPEKQARLLLTYAFCREVIDRIEDRALADFVTDRVVERLPSRGALEEPGE